jgi:DNA-directed RNA polymerase subunit H (RpoH/RPB5)
MTERYNNIYRTIGEMFNQREYSDIVETDDDCLVAIKTDGNQVCVFKNVVEKLNVDEIHNHISILQNKDINHGIIIYEGMPTPAVKNVIANTPELKLNIELFHADDLQYNITKHRLVPKHIKLDKDESKVFKDRHGTDIQILLKTDPITRFYDFAKGDIIKIIRRDGFPSYRIVR